MPIEGSRNWSAKEGTDFGGGNRRLVVTGEAQTSSLNRIPVLAEAVPQGTNPAILILELSEYLSSDVGGDALDWKPVSFEKPVSEGEYSQVDIRGHAVVDIEVLVS